MYYGKQFGIVPVPVRVAGQHVIVPLGGEDWMVSDSGNNADAADGFRVHRRHAVAMQELALSKLFGYLPPKEAWPKPSCRRQGPSGACTPTRPLTPSRAANVLGVKYAKMSEATWTAIDAAISGQSVQGALNTAASQIKTVLNG